MKKVFGVIFFVFIFSANVFGQSSNWRLEYDSVKVHFINGKPELTAQWLEKFLPQYRQNLIDTSNYFEMVHLLARCYMRLSKTDDAEKLFKEDITYFKEHPEEISHTTYTSSLVYLGYLYYHKKELDLAEFYFVQGLDQKKKKSGEKNQVYTTLLNNLAIINYLQKEYSTADSIYRKVITLKKDMYGPNSEEATLAVTTLGNMYKKMGKYSDAELLFQQAVSIRKQSNGESHPKYLEAMNNLTSIYVLQGRYDIALTSYQKILETTKTVYQPSNIEYTKAMNNLGNLYLQMNKFPESQSIYQEVLNLREEHFGMNNLDYTEALINLATIYKTMSDYTMSEMFYKSALSIYEVIIGERHQTYIVCLVSLANLYTSMGRLSEAEPLYLKAAGIYKETIGENTHNYSSLLNNIALFYYHVGNYELSEKTFKQSLEITRNILGDSHPDYATTLSNLADLYRNTGHFEQAEPLYMQSLKIRQDVLGEKHPDYAVSLNNLATLYEAMNITDEAEPLYNQCLKIIKDLYGTKNAYYAQALINLAGLYQNEGKYTEAEKLYKESTEIILQVLGEKHYMYATVLNNLANLKLRKKDYKESEKLYLENIENTKKSLGSKHPTYATNLSNLAELYEHIGKYEDAQKLYLEVLEIRKAAFGDKHYQYTYTLSELARIYTANQNYEAADTLWNKIIDNYKYEIKTFFPLRSSKEKEQFYKTISTEIEIFNSYALLRAPSNPKILELMYDNQLATKALLLSSTNRLRQNILASKDTSLVNTFKKWLSEKELLSKLYALPLDEIKKQKLNPDSIQKIANNLERYLSQKSEEFKNNEIKFYSWKDVQKKLGPKEAALEMICFRKFKFDSAGTFKDSVYYAALLVKSTTTDHPEIVLMKNGNKMQGKFLALYKNSVKYKIEDKTSYEAFWKPLQGSMAGIDKLYFSPDGLYNQINLNTLKNPETGTFILDEIDVRLVTNTKDMAMPKKHLASSKKNIVLFGNPEYSYSAEKMNDSLTVKTISEYLVPLPGTESEVMTISTDLSKHHWKTSSFLKNQANEKALKSLTSPTILHIATHGFFKNDAVKSKGDEANAKPSENMLLNSGVMLAGASVSLYNRDHNVFNSQDVTSNSEDGILSAYEVCNLNLSNTELVVLSACETGLGEFKNGEGVYGLQRAFIIAGTQSIIISLWKVDDEKTKKLMTYFYQELHRNTDRNLAFKKAQTKLKSEFPEPYFWGAFIIVQ